MTVIATMITWRKIFNQNEMFEGEAPITEDSKNPEIRALSSALSENNADPWQLLVYFEDFKMGSAEEAAFLAREKAEYETNPVAYLQKNQEKLWQALFGDKWEQARKSRIALYQKEESLTKPREKGLMGRLIQKIKGGTPSPADDLAEAH